MLLDDLGKKVLIFDGGFGSELQRRNISSSCPEDLNITHAEDIKAIHASYASADFMTTNTFGLNRIKYHGNYSLKEVALKAIENARSVKDKYVFFDMGPCGKMMAPMGDLTFEECYDAYKEMVDITSSYVDGYIVETFTDLYELKAVILAIKENSSKPVFASMSFDKSGRTLSGSTPEIMVNLLENLGVDALGTNCSLGPKEMLPVVERILASSHIPVIVQPNRGLPTLFNGKTFYSLEYSEFEKYARLFIDKGVSVIGGCCGTNPDFIRGISLFKGLDVVHRNNPYKTSVCSSSRMCEIDNVKVCGERLNPTGKKKLKEALLNEDYDYLVQEAVKEAEAHADLLDLNVGVPKIDEGKVMYNAVKKIQEYSDLPLQLDSSSPEALEKGCRIYNGVPLINSVNGEEAVMERIFPIAKKYGAVVLGLAMDGNGVPKTAEQRYEIAKRIINKAEEYGISRHRIMIDTLVLTASAEQDLVKETLKGLTLVRTLGVKTSLGVSNVSFGLPNRPLLNKTFLSMAMYAGLNMPILNPLDSEMMGAVSAYNVLMGIDKNSQDYIDKYKDVVTNVVTTSLSDSKINMTSESMDLYNAVKKGINVNIEGLTRKELESKEPLSVVNDVLIKALGEVGELYDKGKLFLPQLISSAECAKVAFGVISSLFPKQGKAKSDVVMATVKGDVHDIGKNICKVVLESYGYHVIDLGKDVPVEKVVEAYHQYHPFAIGLSALMTTTVVSMEDTIKALRKENCSSKIFVGGAVLTQEIASSIDADYYTKDALELVNKLEELLVTK